jgi:hypothetical protein
VRDGARKVGRAVGSVLARTPLSMKKWPDPDQAQELACKVRMELALVAIVLVFGIIVLVCAAFGTTAVQAHSGGLAADGCHNDRKNGGRHCHRGGSSSRSPTTQAQRLSRGGSPYLCQLRRRARRWGRTGSPRRSGLCAPPRP